MGIFLKFSCSPVHGPFPLLILQEDLEQAARKKVVLFIP